MNFTVISLSHKEAHIEVREKISLTKDEIRCLLRKFYKLFKIKEIVILSTCNRLEIYFIAPDSNFNNQNLVDEFLTFKKFTNSSNVPFVIKQSLEAYKHLFRVSSSLESMVIGENQIINQVKDAFYFSKYLGFVYSQLEIIFQKTFSVSKKIKSQTSIFNNSVSIGSTVSNLVLNIFDNLKNKKALIVGAGEMAELIANHLKEMGISRIFITNRTFKNSIKLAEKLQGSAIWYGERYNYLSESDIVITSTGSKNFVLEYNNTAKILSKNKKNSILFIDIAVPRDIDPEIGKISNVYLYHLDDLQSIIFSKDSLQKDIIKSELILKENLEKFINLLEYREKNSLIEALIQQQNTIIKQELKLFFYKNPEQQQNKDIIEKIVNRINKKFLHLPFLFLKKGYSKEINLIFADIFGFDEKKISPDLKIITEKKNNLKKLIN